MKKIILAMVTMLATSMVSVAQSYNYGNNSRRSTTTSTYGSYGTNPSTTSVSGYTRSNGTYVNGYTRTQRNGTNHDNFSTSGNSIHTTAQLAVVQETIPHSRTIMAPVIRYRPVPVVDNITQIVAEIRCMYQRDK